MSAMSLGATTVSLPKLMREFVPHQSVSETQWTGHQHWMLCDPGAYPVRSLQRVCEDLVAKWNRQQPQTWRYWLA